MKLTFLPQEAAQIRHELEQVLSSPNFVASKRYKALLVFLVEETLAGRGDGLKAYTIATEVFNRPASFDPQRDSVVRVEVGNLRKKLAKYYRLHLNQGLIEITVPTGRYVPVFLARQQHQAAQPAQVNVNNAAANNFSSRANNASNSHLTASKACLRPFGGKDFGESLQSISSVKCSSFRFFSRYARPAPAGVRQKQGHACQEIFNVELFRGLRPD